MSTPVASASTPLAERGPVDVSVLIPVLNEERHIRETVAAMQAQRLQGSLELLFADGRSNDRTREILEELAVRDPRIRILENPRRHTASGLNVCLREARGEFVARMDAHTYYSPDYLSAGLRRLRRGDTEWVSGPAVPRPEGSISRAVALALASPLGRGRSRKWSGDGQAGEERELDTGVFGGVWRRSTLLAAGGWDERWPINQDSEMAARFLDRGARLVCVAQMTGYYVPRDSLQSLARQHFRYGFYRARTFRRHPRSMRLSHVLAPALAMSAVCAAAAPRRLRTLARAGLGVYVSALAASAAGARDASARERALLLAVLPTMHLGWGFGTLAGVARFGPPVAAIRHAIALRARDAPAQSTDRGEVYAPSLHDPSG
jgi:succinoglycan biosynthesis protein ExoA